MSDCALGGSLQESPVTDRADSNAHLVVLGYAIGVMECTERHG